MTASFPAHIGAHLVDAVPEPVLFNIWKHHAGMLRQRVREAAFKGEAGLDELAGNLVVLGTELMDLYSGPLSPQEIAERVIANLESQGRLPLQPFQRWLADAGGYRVLTLEDMSRWVLRLGDEAGRYVHVHPARWAPQTRRVRANVLKTTVLVLAWTAVHGGNPLDIGIVNRVRQQYLSLSPIGRVPDDQGLGLVIEFLGSTP
jgi:hypothetical protein